MTRYILRHCTVFCGITLIFFIISGLYGINLKSEYPDIQGHEFQITPDIAAPDVLRTVQEHVVVPENDATNSELFSDCYFVLLLNDTTQEIYAAKNAHRRMYPASMTKLMTAIIVCDKIEAGEISLDDVVTVSNYYDLTAEDVEPCAYKPGSKLTVKDLLYGLMLESNNYFALILADYVAGDTASFCELMNQKAYSIGATNTHYMNPHGLDNPEHYSTAYDIYLIIKEAYSHEILRTLDTYSEYSFTYTDAAGAPVNVDCGATNMFVNGKAALPSNFNILVWKTGTTTGAGNCLAMYLSKGDENYFIVAASGESRNVLYDAMIKLLCLI